MSSRRVGNYRLVSLLGSGGMGEVYRAYDTYRHRYVALKLLPEAFTGDEEYLKRFQEESRVAAQLQEPHVIPIHDFGEIDGRLFIDMRLVDGTDLGTLLEANGPIAPQRAVDLVSQVAQALDAAHADDLVHGDIRPSNILVTSSDFVYVVDFGIARPARDRSAALAVSGTPAGTPHYTAPEQFAGQHVDGRADVFSLACLLHECLAGEPPFTDYDRPALTDAPLRPGIPPTLDAVIARGTAQVPRDRYPTAGALARAARAALQTATPPPPPLPLAMELAAPAGTERPDPAGQTVSMNSAGDWGGVRPPENMPQGTTPGPDDGRFPPDEAPGEQARGPGRLFLGLLLLVALACLAVPIVIVVMVSSGPRTSASAVLPTAALPRGGATGTRTAEATSSAPSAKRELPAVAGTITVGQNPSYVQIAPNGRFAYIAEPGASVITVLDTATGRVSGHITIPAGPPQFVSFSPDSRTAYVSVYNTRNSAVHLIAFIDTATSTVTSTVQVNNFSPGPLTTSPNGRYLYVPNRNMTMSGSDVNVVDVIDTASKRLITSIAVPWNPHWVVFGKSGQRFYTTDHMSARVTVLDAASNRIITEIRVGETPHSEAISPDGRRLAVTSYSGNVVFLINTATDRMIAQIPVGKNPVDIAYSPDGDYLYTVNNEDNTVTVIGTADNRVIGSVRTGKAPTSISVLPNGHRAYVSDENDGTIEVLDIRS